MLQNTLYTETYFYCHLKELNQEPHNTNNMQQNINCIIQSAL